MRSSSLADRSSLEIGANANRRVRTYLDEGLETSKCRELNHLHVFSVALLQPFSKNGLEPGLPTDIRSYYPNHHIVLSFFIRCCMAAGIDTQSLNKPVSESCYVY